MNKTKITSEIVADSINQQGDRLISVLATFPRIILAEMNTHRMLSKNTSSSRAIPFNKMVESVKNDPFIPIAWQKKHKGMQGFEYFESKWEINQRNINWLHGRDSAIAIAKLLNEKNGVTKQLCNRLLEPFMWTTMLITGSKSGWDNFFKLRNPVYKVGINKFKSKKDVLDYYSDEPNYIEFKKYTDLDWLKLNEGQAEIHMMALAESIWDNFNESTPKQLKSGEWHIPFLDKIDVYDDVFSTFTNGDRFIDFNEVMKVSVSLAARTSYTVVGEEKEIDYQKMIDLHDRLLAQDPPHSSPMEHCCRALTNEEYYTFNRGCATNADDIGEGLIFESHSQGWVNNIKGFMPYRYIVDNSLPL